MDEVVVIGAGLAGLETVVALRDHGYARRLTLVGAERHLPYERPPLSKAMLTADAEPKMLEVDWDELDVDVRLGCRGLGVGDGLVETSAGELPFDGLVIATGAVPIELPGTDSLPNIHTLRTIDDALAIRAACVPGAHVVVIGAGWIGTEVAWGAAHRGCSVTVLEAAEVPLATVMPREIGERFAPWFAEAGVTLRVGARVVGVEAGVVHLDDGSSLSADCVITGIGVRPETAWLRGSRVALDAAGWVLTDASLRTSQPGVMALGDCSAWESPRFGETLHVEHWDNAQRAPDVAARTLLGQEATYDPVPYFWSESFGRMVQYAGHGGSQVVMREDPESCAWAGCFLHDGRLRAILAVDRPRDVAQGRKLIAAGARIDSRQLGDPDVALKECAR